MTAVLSAAVLLLAAGTVLAEDAEPAAAPVPPTPAAFAASTPLTTEKLDEQRAKAKIEIDKLTINAPEQNGVVAGNTAVGNNTGHNSIGGDAFTSAAGFISTIQNTGNNVLIQNSTIINVSVEQ
jgi:hypothetical protein